jgi:uroporphyrinogen-III synthase
MGFDAIVEPLLAVRPLADVRLDLARVGAIAFTSVNAVAVFTRLTSDRRLRVFAVGDATADAARAAGFASVTSAGGDADALAATISSHRDEFAGAVLYPAPAETSQDLAGALRATRLEVRQVALYETLANPPSKALLERLGDLDGVVVHSARAAGLLSDVLKAHPAPRLVAFCLSPQVAAPLAGLGAQVRTSAAPAEAALLSLVGAAWR